jgi:hypothetical protein
VGPSFLRVLRLVFFAMEGGVCDRFGAGKSTRAEVANP